MIIEDIKNSIRQLLNLMDKNLIFHFEKIKHTGFPYVILKILDFKILSTAIKNKKEYKLSFELIFQLSEENLLSELFILQDKLSEILLPTIDVLGEKIFLDEVNFAVIENKLSMKFKMNFFEYKNNEEEIMQTLDITIEGGKNVR